MNRLLYTSPRVRQEQERAERQIEHGVLCLADWIELGFLPATIVERVRAAIAVYDNQQATQERHTSGKEETRNDALSEP